jgi:hypothetical protein
MVKDVISVRRKNNKVISGHLLKHTTPNETYEMRNMGTLHRPHWTIEDDSGKTIGISNRCYRAYFMSSPHEK